MLNLEQGGTKTKLGSFFENQKFLKNLIDVICCSTQLHDSKIIPKFLVWTLVLWQLFALLLYIFFLNLMLVTLKEVALQWEGQPLPKADIKGQPKALSILLCTSGI